MITHNDIVGLVGTAVYDADGGKIGLAGEIYLDTETGDPTWVTVKSGLLGGNETFVPLRGVSVANGRITVAFGKDQITNAPQVDADGPLSRAEEDQLTDYYELLDIDQAGSGSETDRSGDDAPTRAEELLVTAAQAERTGRARLRTEVVTEHRQVTVPLAHEERETNTDAKARNALDGPHTSEAEPEVTLHAERPVVNVEAVPVERVALSKETIHDEETGEVRKEEVKFDGPEGRQHQ